MSTCKVDRGVLIECDVPTKQLILYLNEKGDMGSFVIYDLDSTHLIVSEEVVEDVEKRIKEFVEKQNQNAKEKRYSRIA